MGLVSALVKMSLLKRVIRMVSGKAGGRRRY
jgi:hypothetical protein